MTTTCLLLSMLIVAGGSAPTPAPAPADLPAAGFLVPPSSAEQSPEARPRGWRFWVGLPTAALGVASLVISAGLAAEASSALSEADRIAAQIEETDLNTAELDRLTARLDQNDGPELEAGQWALFATGLLLIAGGTGLMIWDWVMPEPLTDVQIALGPDGRGGGGIFVGGRW